MNSKATQSDSLNEKSDDRRVSDVVRKNGSAIRLFLSLEKSMKPMVTETAPIRRGQRAVACGGAMPFSAATGEVVKPI